MRNAGTTGRRLLGRRDALVVLGLGGLGIGALGRPRRVAAKCVLVPEQTEGPYYVANDLLRRDITEGRAGFPLSLRLTVRDAATCQPIAGADVELWHCDADGVYSGVAGDTGTFLRGRQPSDERGKVLFDTIYPGWYTSRTPHIHVKVHVGGSVVHTGQLYFDTATTSAVYRKAPYAARGQADTTNATDGIFADGGTASTLALRRRRKRVRGKIVLAVGV